MLIVPNIYYDKYDDILIHWYNDGEYLWYRFYDVAKAFGYNENSMVDTWNNFIDNNDKTIFEEEVEDWKGNKLVNERRYINTVALFKLCDKYERVIGSLRKHVRNIEIDNGFAKVNDDNNHILKTNLGMMEQCLNDKNYEKLASVSKIVLDSKQIQQIRYSNPLKEEIINEFRNDVYACDEIEEIEWNIKMTKREDDSEEERKAKYKRYKENGNKSTCPAWIKDIIK